MDLRYNGRGFELWRKLHAEWEGAAPQVVAAKDRQFQDPIMCTTILKLWEALPISEQLGAEVISGGYALPDWLWANSSENFIPEHVVSTPVGRPELSAYFPKLTWTRAQMKQARAQHLEPLRPKRGQNQDVDMEALAKGLHGEQAHEQGEKPEPSPCP